MQTTNDGVVKNRRVVSPFPFVYLTIKSGHPMAEQA